MYTKLMSMPITIQNPGATTDQYNRAGADWDHPVSTVVNGWFDIGMRKMAEDEHNRDGGTSDGTAFLPSGSPVTTTSRLVIFGLTYQVFGVPTEAHTPSGAHHIECRVQRFVG